MKLLTVPVGELRTNCYVIWDEQSREALIVDPGGEPDKIIKEIDKLSLRPKVIVNTHGHPDHILGNRKLKEAYNIRAYLHAADFKILKYFSVLIPAGVNIFEYASIDGPLSEDDCFQVGDNKFIILETPGHSPGGVCVFDGKETLFTGDTVFAGDVGRSDLPFASFNQMRASLQKIIRLPSQIKIYPGHGRQTDLISEIPVLNQEINA